MKHRFRLIQCTKNRFGRADVNIGATFHGEIGMFSELPRPDEISDYAIYTEIETTGKPIENHTETPTDNKQTKDENNNLIYQF